MNVQEYISSGIVESYVLGLASPEEQREFEQMSAQHPEVLEARIAFETSLEQQAMNNAIIPPPAFKEQVTAAVFKDSKAREARVVAIDRGAAVVKTSWIKYAAAAAVVLLVGSLFWNISLFNENNKLKANYTAASGRLADLEKDMATLMNPNVQMTAMKGLDASPASYTTVYWDSTTKSVFLLVNNLPKPASDKQYQLWAILDGKPVDLGMINNEYLVGQRPLLLRMNNASGAQAFAITLEKAGGNPQPQGTMYTLGNR
ncbi:MAG: anti-sigma factor [Chitinophagaceae bacterium]